MRSTDCGLRIGDCGLDGWRSIPQSAIRNPQLFVGALLLALLPPPARAQQPDSLPKDSATLAPVVVTGVRLPSVRELARGLAGRTAALSATDLDARGVRAPAGASPRARARTPGQRGRERTPPDSPPPFKSY